MASRSPPPSGHEAPTWGGGVTHHSRIEGTDGSSGQERCPDVQPSHCARKPPPIRPPDRVQTWPRLFRVLISPFPPQVSPGTAPPLSFGLVSKPLLPPGHRP